MPKRSLSEQQSEHAGAEIQTMRKEILDLRSNVQAKDRRDAQLREDGQAKDRRSALISQSEEGLGTMGMKNTPIRISRMDLHSSTANLRAGGAIKLARERLSERLPVIQKFLHY